VTMGAPDSVALVQGASRGVGLAFVHALLAKPNVNRVFATCRRPDEASALVALGATDARLRILRLDVTDEESIAAAAAEARDSADRIDLLINSAGILHEGEMGPERNLAQVRPENLVKAFRVNALGPLLVAKSFEPLLKRSPEACFASLSARVGSIGDNRLGGWYAYRSSKAALNQMTRTLAVQWRRLTRPILCVVLHPGTVATDLSAPFTGSYDPAKLFEPDRAAGQLLDVLAGLTIADTGGFFAWDGQPIPW